MSDNRFLIQFSSLLIMIIIAFIILISMPTSKQELDSSSFLISLKEIDGDLQDIEFKKRVKEVKVAIFKKEDIKIVAKPKKIKKRDSVNKDIKPAKESIIRINSNSSKKSFIYKNLERRFNKTYDYKLALKLSRLYFSKKMYYYSLKWAKIANELNDKDENSWILFAKSKIKLGDKKSAQIALMTYYKSYKSKKIKNLLRRIDS